MDAVLYGVKALLIGAGFFCMGVSGVVVFRFMRYWYKGRSGLLPLHVWLVALSYNLLLGLAITARINGLGDPFWRWIVYTVAVAIGIAAMFVVAKVQYTERRAQHQAEKKKT